MFVDEDPLSCPFVHAVPAFPTTTFPDGIHSLHYNHTEDDDYSNLILLQLMMMAKKKNITVLHILIDENDDKVIDDNNENIHVMTKRIL